MKFNYILKAVNIIIKWKKCKTKWIFCENIAEVDVYGCCMSFNPFAATNSLKTKSKTKAQKKVEKQNSNEKQFQR